MYHNGSRLSEIVKYTVYIEQWNESEPVQERQITPVTSWLQGQHPKTVLRIPQTNLESSIHQSHVIVMWEEAGGTRKLSTEKSPAPRGFESRTFLLCPDSPNQLVKPANRTRVCLLGVHHLTCGSQHIHINIVTCLLRLKEDFRGLEESRCTAVFTSPRPASGCPPQLSIWWNKNKWHAHVGSAARMCGWFWNAVKESEWQRGREREREVGGGLTEGESRYVRTKQNILDRQLKGPSKDY